MKLIFCEKCGDLFKLDYEMRYCKCKRCFGRYIDNTYAEVSKDSVSIAIGNGSLEQAIGEMRNFLHETNDNAEREEYHETGKGKIEFAWVRPNSGNGNPHTKVIKISSTTNER